MSVEAQGWGGLSGARWGAEGETYHGHLLLEVLQVPAVLGGLALLRRALVIFLVLRGGDTIAVRATRLRARRGYEGTGPPSRSPLPCVSACVSGWVSLWLWVSLKLVSLASAEWPHCLWLHVLLGVCPRASPSGCLRISLLLRPGMQVTPSVSVSFYLCMSPLSPSPPPQACPTFQVSVSCVYLSLS